MDRQVATHVRSWTCKACQTKHDRDINAVNIRDEGMRLLALGTSATASGESVRPKPGRKTSVEATVREARSLHCIGTPISVG